MPMARTKTITYQRDKLRTSRRSLPTKQQRKALAAADSAEQSPMSSGRRSQQPGNITIPKEAHENLKKRAQDASKFARDLETAKKALEKAKEAEVSRMSEFDKVLLEKQQELQELKRKMDDLEKGLPPSLVTPGTSRKRAKIDKASLNEELVSFSDMVAKDVMFRTFIFPEDEEELDEITEIGIKYLPIPLSGITKEQYVRDYKEIYHKGIKDARQNVQSECKKRAQGT
jgi:bifunctional DNA-binding transcriptional regulator/antitoxin component of YhaV-PrlF toxin-antitoxin module